MNKTVLSLVSIDEIEIGNWINDSKKNRLLNTVSNSFGYLSSSGLIEPFLNYWVDLEIHQEYSAREKGVNEFSQHVTDIFSASPAEQVFPEMQLIDSSIYSWSMNKWEHKLEFLYLENKSKLDTVLFRLLRVRSRNLAQELYYRIKEGESSFVSISNDYGRPPEINNGGKVSEQSITIFPAEIQKRVRQMQPGDMLRPFQFGDFYAIIQIISVNLPGFDEVIKRKILRCQYDHWRTHAVQKLITFLDSSLTFQPKAL